MNILSQIVAIAVLIDAVAAQCSLCTGGPDKLVDPNAKLGGSTCAEVEATLTPLSSALCNTMKTGANFYLDYSAFCCDDKGPKTPTCEVCPPQHEIIPEDIATPGNNLASTCAEAVLGAKYSVSTAACKVLQEVGTTCCIGEPSASPSALPTESPSVSPTGLPSVSPTASPTVSPTASPIPPPTKSPTASPTPASSLRPTKTAGGGSSQSGVDDDDGTAGEETSYDASDPSVNGAEGQQGSSASSLSSVVVSIGTLGLAVVLSSCSLA
eukprot:scaffold23479_cov143-Cylindrotheca_fusiformis.AAC.3